jgi:hypothetical protein
LHTVDIHPVRSEGYVLRGRSLDTTTFVPEKFAFFQLFATHNCPSGHLLDPVMYVV